MATTAQQRNVELIRQGYQAFDRGDMDTVRERLHPEVVWHVGGNSQLAGDYKGVDATLQVLGQFLQMTEGTYSAEIHDILANDQHGVVMGVQRAERRNEKLELRFVDSLHIDAEGRITEFWRFPEDTNRSDEFIS